MSTPVAFLVGLGLVPATYAIQWVGWKLLSWWTRPRCEPYERQLREYERAAAAARRAAITYGAERSQQADDESAPP